MSEHPLRQLKRLGRELEELVAALIIHLEERNLEAMALDVSGIVAATAAINALTAQITASISGDVSTAVAAQAAADQAAVAAAVGPLTTAIAALQAAVTPASGGTPPATGLTVGAISVPVGSTSSVPVSITGAVGTVTVTGLPAGLTFDGSNIVPDGTQAAGATTVTFSDSSTPPLTGTATVTVA